MDPNSEPILTLDLGTNGQFNFFSHSELHDWVQAQRQLYESLFSQNREKTVPSAVVEKLGPIFSAIASATKIPQNATPEQIQTIYAACKKTLQKYFSDNQLPTVQSPRGNFLSSMPPTRAAYALSYYLGINLPLTASSPEGLRGVVQALLCDLGYSNASEPAASSLQSLYNEWSAKLSESKQTEAQLKADHESEISAQRAATTEHKAQLAATLTETSTQLTQKLSDVESQLSQKLLDAENRLKAVEKTYDEKLALRSAVTYWETKARSHKWWAVVWGVFSVISAIAATWFTLNSVKQTLGVTKITEAQLSQVSELALIAIFGVWLMRVLVRLMLSNTHLHTDASERRTMMLTYLAMMREGQLPEGNSRDLILQALFRPTSTGIIKDDASPPFMAEWLKCTVGKE